MKSKYYYEYTRNMDTTQANAEELKRVNDKLFKMEKFANKFLDIITNKKVETLIIGFLGLFMLYVVVMTVLLAYTIITNHIM